MLQMQTNPTPANEGPRLSTSLGKLGADASKKAAAAPRPLLQPSSTDGKDPAMIDTEEPKVRGPMPPRAKRNADSAESAKDGLTGLMNETALPGLSDGTPELSETDLAGLCSHLRSERQTLTQLEKNLLNREQALLQQEQQTREQLSQEEQRLAQVSHHLRQWEKEFQEKLMAAETELAAEEKRLSQLAAELAAQRSQLEEERTQFLKQRKELRAREIELQVLRDDADGEIQRLKDETAAERHKYVEAHAKLTQERLRLLRLREIFHERTQALRA